MVGQVDYTARPGSYQSDSAGRNGPCRLRNPVTKELDALSGEQQRPASEVVRDSLRRYIAVQKFQQLRGKALPFAEARGFLPDEDVFEAIS